MSIITDDNIRKRIDKAKKNQEIITDWDVSRVTDMHALFHEWRDFNQPLNWDTSNVLTMEGMFYGCTRFNSELRFNTRHVEMMDNMFKGCTDFNQPLNFNTQHVTDMKAMFFNCRSFNQRLHFDTHNVESMTDMFRGCTNFNQPLHFNTQIVTNMERMFMNCTSFNQSLDNWDFSSVVDMHDILTGCTSFTYTHPSLLLEQEEQEEQEHQGIAFEVHNKFTKFLPIRAKYLSIIKQPEIDFGNNIPRYFRDVQDTFTTKIKKLFTGHDQTQKLQQLQRAFDKIRNSLPGQSPEYLQLIVKSINFAFSREDDFTTEYLKIFLDESCNAYAGSGDTTSCVNGIIERFVLAVGSAAETLCTTGECDPIYKELDDLMNSKFQLSVYAEKWWDEEIQKPEIKDLSPQGKKSNFIHYLIENARRLNQYNPTVESQINEEAEKLDYAFHLGQLGGSRKSRKCRKSRNFKKSRKCRKSNKKSRKSSRRRRNTRKAKPVKI